MLSTLLPGRIHRTSLSTFGQWQLEVIQHKIEAFDTVAMITTFLLAFMFDKLMDLDRDGWRDEKYFYWYTLGAQGFSPASRRASHLLGDCVAQ